jgi:hypothetical protein
MTIYLRRKQPPVTDDSWEKQAVKDNQSDFQALNDDLDHLCVQDIERDQEHLEANEHALTEVPPEPSPPPKRKVVSKARDIFISVGRALSGFQNISVTSPRINSIPLVSAAVYGEQVVHPKMKSVKTKSPKIKKQTVKSTRIKSAGKIIKQNSVPIKKLKFQSIKKAYSRK